MDHEQQAPAAQPGLPGGHDNRPIIGVPPQGDELQVLTGQELSALAGAVVSEQHRRAGVEGRRARTAAARAASQALPPEAQRAKTAAATQARAVKRLGANTSDDTVPPS